MVDGKDYFQQANWATVSGIVGLVNYTFEIGILNNKQKSGKKIIFL